MGLSNVGGLMSRPVIHDANDLEDEPEFEPEPGRENRYKCHPSRSEPKKMIDVRIMREIGQRRRRRHRRRTFSAGVKPISHFSVSLWHFQH